MSPEISERAFEEAIECGLLQYGPNTRTGEAPVPQGATRLRKATARSRRSPPSGRRREE